MPFDSQKYVERYQQTQRGVDAALAAIVARLNTPPVAHIKAGQAGKEGG